MHIGGIAREGHRQVVDLHLCSHLDVGAILVGQRRRGKAAALAVDALVVRQRATDQHLGNQARRRDFDHTQLNAAVIQQENVARTAVVDQRLVINAYGRGVASLLVEAGVQHEPLSFLQINLRLGEARDADLRPLQVRQNGDEAPLPLRGLAHEQRPGQVIFGLAVGKVQANNIDAGIDQMLDGLGRIRGRAEGCDYFCSSLHEVQILAGNARLF